MPRVQRKTAVKVPRRKATAIMRVAEPGPRPWELTRDQVDLLKQTICKGATDDELKLCLEISRRHKLDPFRAQIWFVPRNNNGVKIWVTVVGINGLTHIAARDHADYGSIEEPEFGPMQTFNWTRYKKGGATKSGTINAPEWARVKVFKKGMDRPTVATVFFEEIYTPYGIGSSPMVRQMPRHMIGKVATAHAIRKAWPATDGLYIHEEMVRPPDYTPEGRQIIYPDAPSASAPLDENAAHGHPEGSAAARKAAETLRRVEEADAAIKGEKALPAPPVSQGRPPLGTVELDLSVEPGYLRGDLSNLLEMIKKHTHAYWDKKESWWRISKNEAETIREMCKQCNYALNEIQPKDSKRKEETKSARTAGVGDNSAKTKTPAEPHIAEGTITHSIAGMAGKIPVRDVSMFIPTKKTKPTFRCFDRGLFEWLDRGIGKESAVIVKQNGKYWNLTGLRRIGSQEFEEDGKTPAAIQVDREPGFNFNGGGK